VSPTHPRIPGRRLLHSPGPTPLPDEVQDALRRQPMDLGDPRVAANIAACEQGLRRLLGSQGVEVFFYAANGHGAWEAVIENLVPPGGAVLIPGTGHFSESWAVQAEGLARKVVRTPWHEGLPIDAQAVTQALRADSAREILAVFVVHTDTASGVTSDLAELRKAIDAADHPALFVVDVVASLGAAPFSMDALRANVALGASQKGLMTPPGVGIVAVDSAALAVAQRNSGPRFYWDWRLRQSELSYRKFCGTAPQNLMFALEAALGLIFAEGIGAVHRRHELLARAVQAAVQGWREAGALDFFAKQPASRSVSVTTIAVAPGIDVEALRSVARERFQVAVAGGLGPLAGRAFRIGHMGDQNPAQILGALGAVQAALQVQGIAHGRDGLNRAIASLAGA
jgi:alanine-glyoxylate transaminase / serine-glyoxylate transaminase / serine-pyruvate transaminase